MLHFYLLLEVRSSCSVTCAATKRTNVLEILIPDPSSSACTHLLVFLTVGVGWEDFTAILDGKVDEFCSRGFFVKWRFRSFWKHSVGLRDLGSATVCLCLGQAGDGLPPASYQHTLSVCVSVFKRCKGRDSEIRGEVGKRRMNSGSIVLSSHLGWYSSLFVLLLLTF